tara:strand:+ start:839 stop:1246 length:408 start_codon:yes stop_codon:yes gene_type:complete
MYGQQSPASVKQCVDGFGKCNTYLFVSPVVRSLSDRRRELQQQPAVAFLYCKKKVSVSYIAKYGQTVTSFGKTGRRDLGNAQGRTFCFVPVACVTSKVGFITPNFTAALDLYTAKSTKIRGPFCGDGDGGAEVGG